MQTPTIQITKLFKDFGEGASLTNVLRGMDITILQGEFVIVFGPSGSGKSTLLNIINGLEIPTSGSVVIDGSDITKLSENERARFHQEKIGMVFQAYNLIPSLTVIQNITLPLVFTKKVPKERDSVARQLLTDFGLSELADRLPSEISGGQQQRVGIMRALANRPPIIVADEPTGNLDSVATQKVMDLFRKLNKEYQNTTIVVTHDQSLFKYADRIIHILDGKVIKQSARHAEQPAAKHAAPTIFEQNLKSATAPTRVRLLHLLSAILSSHHLSSFDQTELDRTIDYMGQFSKGKLSVSQLYKRLDDPLSKGGAGLYRSTAHHIADSMEDMLEVLK